MLKELIKNFYFKFHLSAYYNKLNHLKSLLNTDSKSDFQISAESFYFELLQFPYIYYHQFSPAQNRRELLNQLSVLPEGDIKKIYQQHLELFLRIENTIVDPATGDVKKLLNNIESFLDDIFLSFNNSNKSFTVYGKYIFITVFLISCICITPSLYTFLKNKYIAEKETYLLISTAEARYKKGIDDVLLLKDALQRYYNDNKSYPKSSGGWDGIISPFGLSKEDWIPGLAPKYIEKLPVDPRRSKDSSGQYMYKSDGIDYKLMSHKPENIEYVKSNHPELIDPVRNSWAFGVWSEKAKNW